MFTVALVIAVDNDVAKEVIHVPSKPHHSKDVVESLHKSLTPLVISHDGSVLLLDKHVTNVTAEVSGNGRKLFIVVFDSMAFLVA